MAWVALSGKAVALFQWMGDVKIWSQREAVREEESFRRSDPEADAKGILNQYKDLRWETGRDGRLTVLSVEDRQSERRGLEELSALKVLLDKLLGRTGEVD